MSGHNKWSQIKHKKAKEDGKKAKAFTRLIKEITVCARNGGGDPAFNPALRFLLEQARAINMPLDNATRAIKRGTGELPGVNYEHFTYEGYAKYGIAVMVDTLSDNKNRTVAELRHIFSSHGCHLAEAGSVSWLFNHCGTVRIVGIVSEDSLLNILINFDVIDIKHEEEDTVVLCTTKSLDSVCNVLKEQKYTVKSAQFEWIAKSSIHLDQKELDEVVEFLSELEEHDDVQNVYTTLE
ncbi:MAG TPA: YebC/PmpR family DNA-binding transcriptional regulator [Patescibacteria group bacterium]|jgi:YebC/PmpR family DNA-binding regulatory protein|nr:YebC/PmpR family DNA-binding transcriptional regulator [Patescibacteria group bacterium]